MRPLGRGGLTVGPLAFGSAPIGNLCREVDRRVARRAVAPAWDAGVRYFDTAPHYGLGLSERRLGAGLREAATAFDRLDQGRAACSSRGRGDDLDDEGFAVPATHVRVCDFSRDGVLRSLESSLERLGLDRVDVAARPRPRRPLPRGARRAPSRRWRSCATQGVIAAYGAGMNQAEMLADFVRETDIDVVMLAGRYTLLEQDALDDLLPECERRGVSVIAAGVFNSGLLAARARATTRRTTTSRRRRSVLARVHRIADVLERHGATLPVAAAHSRSRIRPWPASASARAPPRRSSATPHCSTSRSRTPRGRSSSAEGLVRADAAIPTGERRMTARTS